VEVVVPEKKPQGVAKKVGEHAAKDEAREAEGLLTDDELEQVSGGTLQYQKMAVKQARDDAKMALVVKKP
jgi:bacteriocin-like protein